MSPRGEGREHLTFPVLKDQRMHLLWDDTATRKHKNASSGSKTWGRIESLKCLPKSHRDTVLCTGTQFLSFLSHSHFPSRVVLSSLISFWCLKLGAIVAHKFITLIKQFQVLKGDNIPTVPTKNPAILNGTVQFSYFKPRCLFCQVNYRKKPKPNNKK